MDMNPENNRDTFRGRGFRIQELESENAEMRSILDILWQSGDLPHWAYFDKNEDGNTLIDQINSLLKKNPNT